MSGVHRCKTKEGILERPFVWLNFFNPVASDSKIAVGIASLPCVACHVDLTGDCLALDIQVGA